MEEPTVLGMIYKEIMILRKDVESLKDKESKVVGGAFIISILLTVAFQIALSLIQKA